MASQPFPQADRSVPYNGGTEDSATDTPWEHFLRARIAAIGWLHAQGGMGDADIAKALGMTATEVFLARARQNRKPSSPDSDSDLTQAAPLGDA